MKKTEKLLKIIATVLLIIAAVYYLYSAAKTTVFSIKVLMNENTIGFYNPFTDVSTVISIIFSALVGVFAVILCVRLLQNKSETLALRLLYIVYSLFMLFSVLAYGRLVIKPVNTLNIFFGFVSNPIHVILLIEFIIITLVLIVYRHNCTKKRATALVVLSSALVAFDTIGWTAVFVYLSVNDKFVPFDFSVTYYYTLIMLYLPLLLICILKRFELKIGDNHEIHS